MAAAALFLSLSAGAAADPPNPAAAGAEDAQSAVWTPRELRFVFMGFTSHYSCDGLQAKVRQALLDLGARKDLQVRESGCSASTGRPDPFPGVAIKMNVLAPPKADDATPTTVPAHWKRVNLRLDPNTVLEAGDCELVEQIKQHILPLFTARNIQYRSNCVPHQLSVGGTSLSAEVLVPDAKDAKAARAH
ncbi:MAG: hypothetical protein ACRETP_04540 [Steroidobacteraceae bacterium]